MDHFRIHEATEHLLSHLAVVREGSTYPGADKTAPRWVKVRHRQPFCMKLGATAPVATEEIGREAAQQVANILGLPFEFQSVKTGDSGMPHWETVEPQQTVAA